MREVRLRGSKEEFLIRPYQPGDETRILPSWTEAFGKPWSVEEWRWKYAGNPAGFRCLLALNSAGKVVVHYAGLGAYAVLEGKRVHTLQLVDNFSHPRYRWALGSKTGLFAEVARYFWQTYLEDGPWGENYDLGAPSKSLFFFGFPGERHFRLGQYLVRYARMAAPVFGALRLPQKVSRARNILYRLEEVSRPQEAYFYQTAFDHLWKAFQGKNPFSIIKDFSYLFWRYFSAPGFPYRVYLLRTLFSPHILAWVAIKKVEGYTLIVDFLGKSGEHLSCLLEKVGQALQEETLYVCCSENHFLLPALQRLTFQEALPLWPIIPCSP